MSQRFFECLDDQAVFIHGQSHDIEAMIDEYPQSQRIGRFLDKYGIAGASEQAANEIQSLGNSGGGKKMIRVHLEIILFAEKPGQRLMKVPVSLLCTVS